MEFKKEFIELKAVPEGKNLFIEGYAAIFNVEDSYNDIILPGAFTKAISGKEGKRIRLCYQHDMDDVVGKIVEMKEDEKGLWFKAKISNTTLGRDLAELISDEAINEISIGYMAAVWEMDDIRNIRKLKEVKLYEISFVSRAANPQALVTGTEVKNEKEPFEVGKLSDEELIQKKNELEKEIEIRAINKLINII